MWDNDNPGRDTGASGASFWNADIMRRIESNVIIEIVNWVAKPAERNAFAADWSPMEYGITIQNQRRAIDFGVQTRKDTLGRWGRAEVNRHEAEKRPLHVRGQEWRCCERMSRKREEKQIGQSEEQKSLRSKEDQPGSVERHEEMRSILYPCPPWTNGAKGIEVSTKAGKNLISEAEENQEDLRRAWMSDNKRCLLAVAFSDRFRDEGHYEPVYIHPTRGRRDGPSTNILTLIKAVTVADFPVFCTVSCLLDFSRASRDRAACCQLPPSPLASSLLFPASLSFL